MSSEGKRCQICGSSDHSFRWHPGLTEALVIDTLEAAASEVERLEAEQIENSKANTRVARSMGERADAAEAEVERLEIALEAERSSLATDARVQAAEAEVERLESELIASEAGRKSACAERERLREAIKRHRHANVVVGRDHVPEIDQTLYAALHPDEPKEG